MTPAKVTVYEDHKTYPILVKIGGYHLIVEMLGCDVNRHNGVGLDLLYPWYNYPIATKESDEHR